MVEPKTGADASSPSEIHAPNIRTLRTVLPWDLIGAVLVSYAALFLFARHAMGDASTTAFVLPLMGIALVATRFIPVRIAHASWAPWVFRIVSLSFVAANFPRTETGRPMLFDPSAPALLGIMLAVEAVIQAWRERPWGNPPGASLIMLSAMTFTMASMIGEDTFAPGIGGNYVATLTPVYIVLLLLSMRSLERMPRPEASNSGRVLRLVEGGDDRTRRYRIRVALMRTIAIVLAITAGYGCWLPVRFYRQQISTWGNNLLQNQNAPEPSGLSTAPALGDMFNTGGSPTRVLRIDGYSGDAHLRGLSFEDYHDSSWLPTEDNRRLDPATAGALNSTANGPHATVTCYIDSLKEIVAPLNVAGIVPPAGSAVDRSDQSGVMLEVSATAPYRYDLIQSPAGANQGILCPPITPQERRRCLVVPAEIYPGVRSLAASIWNSAAQERLSSASTAAVQEAKIAVISKFLMTHYTYSLTTHPGRGDKVSNFLLGEHAAHCEYFASAAVILLRILGVPSRYVTGYYAHESLGGSTIVRQRDSHAWTECWIDGVGWVTVDATPGGGRPDKLYPSVGSATRMWEWVSDRIFDARAFFARFTPAQLGSTVAVLAGAFYGLRFMISLRRKRLATASLPRYETRDQALVDMAKMFEEYLDRSGVPCPANRPWAEHIDGLRIATAPGGTIGEIAGANGAARRTERATSSKAIDIDKAMIFIRNYNSLRFRPSFDAEQAARTRRLLDDLTAGDAKS